MAVSCELGVLVEHVEAVLLMGGHGRWMADEAEALAGEAGTEGGVLGEAIDTEAHGGVRKER